MLVPWHPLFHSVLTYWQSWNCAISLFTLICIISLSFEFDFCYCRFAITSWFPSTRSLLHKMSHVANLKKLNLNCVKFWFDIFVPLFFFYHVFISIDSLEPANRYLALWFISSITFDKRPTCLGVPAVKLQVMWDCNPSLISGDSYLVVM